MNLTSRPPLGLKSPKAKPNPKYLERVRGLPCVICEAFGMEQLTPTTAHHPIHGRFSQRKVPDEMAIPLCDCHHQGLWFNTGRIALHREPEEWKRRYGEDHEYIAVTQDNLDA